MRAVDTNILVRLIARDDARQTAAAEACIVNGAGVSLLALAEAVWVLASVYELSARDQARGIEMLLDHRQLVLHDHECVAAALKLFPRQTIARLFGLPHAGNGAQGRPLTAWHL